MELRDIWFVKLGLHQVHVLLRILDLIGLADLISLTALISGRSVAVSHS